MFHPTNLRTWNRLSIVSLMDIVKRDPRITGARKNYLEFIQAVFLQSSHSPSLCFPFLNTPEGVSGLKPSVHLNRFLGLTYLFKAGLRNARTPVLLF